MTAPRRIQTWLAIMDTCTGIDLPLERFPQRTLPDRIAAALNGAFNDPHNFERFIVVERSARSGPDSPALAPTPRPAPRPPTAAAAARGRRALAPSEA